MITISKLKCDNSDMCNSCHNREPKELYDIYISYNNSGIGIRLCENCMLDLSNQINQALGVSRLSPQELANLMIAP